MAEYLDKDGLQYYTTLLEGRYAVQDDVPKYLMNISATNHNGIYRGKNLGTIASQSALETFLSTHSVSDGTFDDLYLGDYFTISDGTYNKAWQIAGFDFAYNMGTTDTEARTVHHLAMFPRTQMGTSVMNETATTEGGYYNCYLRTTVLPEILAALQGVLGEEHLIGYREVLSSSVSTTTGYASERTVVENTYIELLSMDLVSGWQLSLYDGSYFLRKLPIFNFINWSQAINRGSAWLRDVASSTQFIGAYSSDGYANAHAATIEHGVFPLVLIG